MGGCCHGWPGLIFAVDFTASNSGTGERSFGGKNLHHLELDGQGVCMCTYACMCVYMLTYVCMCICASLKAWMNMHVCLRAHMYMSTCKSVYICLNVCANVNM